jgi:hypothetical protein
MILNYHFNYIYHFKKKIQIQLLDFKMKSYILKKYKKIKRDNQLAQKKHLLLSQLKKKLNKL